MYSLVYLSAIALRFFRNTVLNTYEMEALPARMRELQSKRGELPTSLKHGNAHKK
jgi:hypothetical protein